MIGGSIIINTFGAAACIGAIYGCIFDSSAADTCGNKCSIEYYSASFVGVNYDDNRQDLSLDIKQQNTCSSNFNSYVYLDSGSPDSVDQNADSESQGESGNEKNDDKENESSEESGSGEYEDDSHDESGDSSGTDGDDASGSDGDSNAEAPEDLEDNASDLEPTEDGNNDETSENNNVDTDSGDGGSVSDNSASSHSDENASSGSTHTRTEVVRTVSSGESSEQPPFEPVEYEQGVIDLLSIISGCLIFLVLVVLLKYIYKFFRIFF